MTIKGLNKKLKRLLNVENNDDRVKLRDILGILEIKSLDTKLLKEKLQARKYDSDPSYTLNLPEIEGNKQRKRDVVDYEITITKRSKSA